MATVEHEVKLRQKNQLTIPEEIIQLLRLEPGDRLVIEVDEAHPDRMQLRPLRRSYAGILDGVFGTDEEALEYVRAERASWDE